MKKILSIFGTRPEAIKLVPLIKKLSLKEEFRSRVCVTAQHREMLDQVLGLFDVEVDHDLDIMQENQSIFDITVKELSKLEKVLETEKPDMVLVQGDTTSSFTASLAAYYFRIKIGHVEAGLRTSDKFNPFPEEMNRRLTDCLADLYFAPTPGAKENLLREGIAPERVFVTGNTGIDTLLMTVEEQKRKNIHQSMKERFQSSFGVSFDYTRSLLVTVHRRESFGQDLENICLGLKKVICNRKDIQMIWPLHPNPNVQNSVRKILGDRERLYLIDPLDYYTFVWLMSQAYLILTDSGGIQEEAPSLGKPVLVMRKKTERPEGIEAGTARLVGVDRENIFSETVRLLDESQSYQAMARATNPYGDGKASERIIDIVARETG